MKPTNGANGSKYKPFRNYKNPPTFAFRLGDIISWNPQMGWLGKTLRECINTHAAFILESAEEGKMVIDEEAKAYARQRIAAMEQGVVQVPGETGSKFLVLEIDRASNTIISSGTTSNPREEVGAVGTPKMEVA